MTARRSMREGGLPTGIIARGGKLSVRYRDPTTGRWVTKATGLSLSQITEAMQAREDLLASGRDQSRQNRATIAPVSRQRVHDVTALSLWGLSDDDIAAALGRLGDVSGTRCMPAQSRAGRHAVVTSATNTATAVTDHVTSVTDVTSAMGKETVEGMTQLSFCSRCSSKIYWAKTGTGSQAPFDARPSKGWLLVERGGELCVSDYRNFYTSHAETCKGGAK